jgi:vacuolar-type H+-ATPase subunit H
MKYIVKKHTLYKQIVYTTIQFCEYELPRLYEDAIQCAQAHQGEIVPEERKETIERRKETLEEQKQNFENCCS